MKLDEEHRSRDPIWLQLDAAELEVLRAAVEDLPEGGRSSLPRRALRRARDIFIPSLKLDRAPRTHFELRRGRRVIAGERADDPGLETVIELLDALRLRAVRALPR